LAKEPLNWPAKAGHTGLGNAIGGLRQSALDEAGQTGQETGSILELVSD